MCPDIRSSSRMLSLRHSIGHRSPFGTRLGGSKSVPYVCCYASPPPTVNYARAIAVEQPLIAMTVQEEIKLPDQIPNIMQSGIHSLPTKRTMNVRSVARDEDTSVAQMRSVPVMDVKIAAPMQGACL